MIKNKTTFQLWEEGDLQADQALTDLVSQLNNIEDSTAPLEEQKKVLRQQIEQVVMFAYNGETQRVAGREIRFTSASVTKTYEAGKVDAVIAKLAGMGDEYQWVMKELAACRKESSRAGGLQIRTVKEGK